MEDFADKVRGIMYGSAVGDAVGLMTETLSTTDAQVKELKFPYDEKIRGFDICDWTDEMDQHIVVMDTLKECISKHKLEGFEHKTFDDPVVKSLRLTTNSDNKYYPAKSLEPTNLFAYKLKYWATEGFQALGDTMGKGCEQIVYQITTRSGYISNPIGISRNIWNKRNRPATNSCLARTPILGILDNFNICIKLTERFCMATHPDPRNVASCVIVVFLIHTFTHHNVPREKIEDIIMLAIQKGKMYLSSKHAKQLDIYCYNDLDQFNLDKEGLTDFVFRSLGCAIWALRYYARSTNRKHIFRRIIMKIVRFGGDADCNASVAGALLGAIGAKKVPNKWISALPNKKWLDELIDKFVDAYNGAEESESEEPPEYIGGSDSDSDSETEDEYES